MPVLFSRLNQWLRGEASHSVHPWHHPIPAHLRVAGMLTLIILVSAALPIVTPSLAAGPQRQAVVLHTGRPADGRAAYQVACAMCHGAAGKGAQPNGPALEGAPWLLNCSSDQLSAVILDGMHGPIPGSPTAYPVMPALRSWLSDEQVAAVATYVLRTFAARPDLVPEALPQLIRNRPPARSIPWSVDELAALQVTAVPNPNLP